MHGVHSFQVWAAMALAGYLPLSSTSTTSRATLISWSPMTFHTEYAGKVPLCNRGIEGPHASQQSSGMVTPALTQQTPISISTRCCCKKATRWHTHTHTRQREKPRTATILAMVLPIVHLYHTAMSCHKGAEKRTKSRDVVEEDVCSTSGDLAFWPCQTTQDIYCPPGTSYILNSNK